jgi:hypothetical protein
MGVVPMIEPTDAAEYSHPRHDDIALLAYSYWEARGQPEGSPDIDWFRAEEELKKRRLRYAPERLSISDTRLD